MVEVSHSDTSCRSTDPVPIPRTTIDGLGADKRGSSFFCYIDNDSSQYRQYHQFRRNRFVHVRSNRQHEEFKQERVLSSSMSGSFHLCDCLWKARACQTSVAPPAIVSNRSNLVVVRYSGRRRSRKIFCQCLKNLWNGTRLYLHQRCLTQEWIERSMASPNIASRCSTVSRLKPQMGRSY